MSLFFRHVIPYFRYLSCLYIHLGLLITDGFVGVKQTVTSDIKILTLYIVTTVFFILYNLFSIEDIVRSKQTLYSFLTM